MSHTLTIEIRVDPTNNRGANEIDQDRVGALLREKTELLQDMRPGERRVIVFDGQSVGFATLEEDE